MMARTLEFLARAVLRGQSAPIVDDATEGDRNSASDKAVHMARQELWRWHIASLPRRLRAAQQADAVDVVLHDGSRMPLAQARATLCDKEQKQLFAPLRSAITEATAAHIEVAGCPLHLMDPSTQSVLWSPSEAAASHADAIAVAAVLRQTRELAEAARQALAVLGDTPVEDAMHLARALNLPARNDVGAHVMHLTRLWWQAAQPHATRGLARIRTPTLLADTVWLHDDVVRVSDTAMANGYGEAWRALVASARGIAAAVGSPGSALVAEGVAWLAVDADNVRRGLDMATSDARRIARIWTAIWTLRARQSMALFVSVVRDGVRLDAQREAMARAIGVDAGATAAMVHAPWPIGSTPLDVIGALRAHATSAAMAASQLHMIRDAADVDALSTGRLWQMNTGDLAPCWSTESATLTRFGDHWRTIVGELL